MFDPSHLAHQSIDCITFHVELHAENCPDVLAYPPFVQNERMRKPRYSIQFGGKKHGDVTTITCTDDDSGGYQEIRCAYGSYDKITLDCGRTQKSISLNYINLTLYYRSFSMCCATDNFMKFVYVEYLILLR